ncbi:MAG: hypothetical protein VB137_13425 [Burkholderia sp.]
MLRKSWHDLAMTTSRKRKRLSDAYRFEEFRPLEEIHGVFDDRVVRVIALVRRAKNGLHCPV